MYHFFRFSSFNLIIVVFGAWTPCIFSDVGGDGDIQELLDDVIPELYLRYRKVLDSSGEETVSLRRVLKNDKEYNIHVKKLKDVNGLKRHNLIVKADTDVNPIIYVNNPVETKIPNAYLSLEEFKELLTGRVLRQRKEFNIRQFKSFPTLKQGNNVATTQNKAVYSSKFNNQYTTAKSINSKERNVSKTIPTRSKIIAEVNTKTTKHMPITNAHVKKTTQFNVVSSSQLQLHSKLVPRAEKVSTNVVLETSRNTPKFFYNVSTSTVALTTSELIENSSIANILSINTIEMPLIETTNTDEKIQKNITNAFINVSQNSTTEEPTTKEIKVKKTTIEESSTQEWTTYKSTIDEPKPKEIITEEMTTENFNTDASTTEELNNIESTTEEPTTIESTSTVKISTKSKRPTLGRPLVFMGGWEH